MEGLDIISNNSIEAKTELMDQESCNHDWIKRRGDYNIKYVSVYAILVKKIDLHVVNT
jgi:hypothetical protein